MSAALKAIGCLALLLQTINASPNITHFAPHAVVPGKKTTLTFSGSGLDSTSNLWTSFGGTARRVTNSNPDLVAFEITCPENVTGIQALQLAGPGGVSNFQLLLADPMRTQPHQNNHQSPTNAHRIAVPAAVDCILKSEQIDYYRFSAKSGETFSIEAIAHRFGSDLDPVVRVLDANGRELAFCDDEPGVWRDARFVFTAPSEGDYLLAVHDAGYAGGSNYDYRLRVSREPLVWYTFPLVDPTDPAIPFEPIGSRAGKFTVSSPANPAEAPGLTATPALAELEPNDNPSQAQPISFPIVLNGKIQRTADKDCFAFNAVKDQNLIFQSQTRSLGSPCDLVLTLKTADGKVLAQSNSSLPADAALTNKFSESGPCLLEVRELSGNSAPNVPYRVKAALSQTGIAASAENNRLEVKPGGTMNVKISISRYDYGGPVTLEIDPPLSGVTLENNTIEEKKNDVEVKIKASDQLTPGTVEHFMMKVRTVAEVPVVFVSTKPALKKSFPLMLNTPAILDGVFSLGIQAD